MQQGPHADTFDEVQLQQDEALRHYHSVLKEFKVKYVSQTEISRKRDAEMNITEDRIKQKSKEKIDKMNQLKNNIIQIRRQLYVYFGKCEFQSPIIMCQKKMDCSYPMGTLFFFFKVRCSLT